MDIAGNESVYNQPIVIHSSELDMQSHSELMKKYRYEVAKTGVMLVKDLDRIPSSLAMAFHYFCDEYNPLVAKSAIFFTLNLANCSNYPGKTQYLKIYYYYIIYVYICIIITTT